MKTINVENVIEEAKKNHNNKYDYSKIVYKNWKSKVCIICPEHGEFWQTPANHLNGSNCPKCVENQSKLEKEIRKMLEKENIYYIFQYKTDWLKHKKLMSIDFYFPEINVAIECQGRQHYKPINFFGGREGFKKLIIRDNLKKELCKKNNINLFFYTNENVKNENTFNDEYEIIKKIKQLYNERNSS